MGFIFQDYNLIESLTVQENIRFTTHFEKLVPRTLKGCSKVAELLHIESYLNNIQLNCLV